MGVSFLGQNGGYCPFGVPLKQPPRGVPPKNDIPNRVCVCSRVFGWLPGHQKPFMPTITHWKWRVHSFQSSCWCNRQRMTQGFRNEPRVSLKENHTGWSIQVIPSFPAEHQQVMKEGSRAFLKPVHLDRELLFFCPSTLPQNQPQCLKKAIATWLSRHFLSDCWIFSRVFHEPTQNISLFAEGSATKLLGMRFFSKAHADRPLGYGLAVARLDESGWGSLKSPARSPISILLISGPRGVWKVRTKFHPSLVPFGNMTYTYTYIYIYK